MKHRRHRVVAFVGAAVILLASTGRLMAAELYIPEVSTVTGEIFSISVVYRAGDVPLVATQNDLIFSPDMIVQQRSDGSPDCAVNPLVNKPATSFAFRPPTRDGNPVVRALVLAFDNLDPLPDGATLYSCRVGTSLHGPGGEKSLQFERLEGADAAGNAVALGGEAGRVIVGVTEPDFSVHPDALAGRRGETVSLAVSLDGYPREVRRLVHGLNAYPATFTGALPCALDAAVSGQASFTFEPAGCEVTGTCGIVRAEVTLDAEPPDQFVLYRCALRIGPDLVPGESYSINCTTLDARGLNGEELYASCYDASLSVLDDPTATPSATPTATDTAVATTATPSPVATLTSSTPPTPTVDPCGSCPPCYPCQIVNGAPICIPAVSGGGGPSCDSGGCSVVQGASSSNGFGLLPVLLVLLVRRIARP